MKLIVGLGNPGKEYAHTRHNIGFIVLDKCVERLSIGFTKQRTYALAKLGNEAVFLKPMRYMNNSGIAVSEVVGKYEVDSILIVYDEIYLPFGELRIRKNGSSGGHKGVSSIIDKLGSNQFNRLRIGIGQPTDEELSDYVLSKFKKSEKRVLDEVIINSSTLVERYIEAGYEEMAALYSTINKPIPSK